MRRALSSLLMCLLAPAAAAQNPPPGGSFDEAFVGLECKRDSDCDDGTFCNGYERCRDALCQSGPTCAEQEPTLECIEEDQACVIRWNVDFQGDANHADLFGQNDPVDHSEPGVFWNVFEVQAFNSTSNSDFDSDPAMPLLSTGASQIAAPLAFQGDLIGWAGIPDADSLRGDYLLLVEAFGVDSSSVDWLISLPTNHYYDLTFTSHDDGNAGRWITFEVDGAGSVVQSNPDPPVTLRAASGADRAISGTATGRVGGEGNWAGLEIVRVPLRSFLIDFQGNDDHGGLFGQTDPVLQSEARVWNGFEVQAFNSTESSDFESDPQLRLLDDRGADLGVALEILGDVLGWSGSSGADPLTGDYLLLVDAFGVSSSELEWQISGLEPGLPYRLTFRAHDDGSADRAVEFNVGGESLTVSNADAPASLDAFSDDEGRIFGKAKNAGVFEGNWAALEIALLPEPAPGTLAATALVTLLGCGRRVQANRR